MVPQRQPTVEKYKPLVETSKEADGSTTITAYVPGFSVEQLCVDVIPETKLTISGNRPYRYTQAKLCFEEEFQVPPNCITTDITAMYKAGLLNVRLPPRLESGSPTAAPIVDDGEKVKVNITRPFKEFSEEFLLAYMVALTMETVKQWAKLMKWILATLVVVLLFMFVKRMNDWNVNA